MIDVIVSEDCPHCEDQIDAMSRSFFAGQYRIIRVGSPEFDAYPDKDIVDAVPFVVIREDEGAIKYASRGVHDGTQLWKIVRQEPTEPFNLRRRRVAVTQ